MPLVSFLLEPIAHLYTIKSDSIVHYASYMTVNGSERYV